MVVPRFEQSGGGARRVQVSPELVDVSGGEPTVRWQAPFDAPLGDVFQLESRIAGEVVSALSLALGEEGYRTLAEQPTRSAEAWAAFQKGEIANEQRDAASVRRALGFFRQAVTLDSSFGLGSARLARLHSVIYSMSSPEPREARLAGEALAQAERLLPDHPAMYHARALYQLLVRNDPPGALATLDSGLVRWPQDVDLLGTGGAVDRRPERTELALARLRRAQELDPRSVNTAVRSASACCRSVSTTRRGGWPIAASSWRRPTCSCCRPGSWPSWAKATRRRPAPWWRARRPRRGSIPRRSPSTSPAPRTCTGCSTRRGERLVLDLPPPRSTTAGRRGRWSGPR